ncbi:MAG: hypothetical protein RL217_2105 [Pseudomonadota bacterium]|jgi:TM2 domain-containing membrane protein YozV
MNDSVKNDDQKYCKDCGQLIHVRAEICPKCGVRQMPAPSLVATTSSGKNRLAAALLALFLGGFGVHKFYLGRIGWGLVYLLFCWTFIPSLVAFIEFILLLVMSDEEFARKYG